MQKNLRLPRIFTLIVFAVSAAINSARADLLAFDDFNDLNSGGGWTTAWTVVNGVSVVADSPITYLLDNGTTIGGGNALKIAAANDNALVRKIAPVTDGRDIFVSFICQIRNEALEDGASLSTLYCGWQAEDDAPSASNDTVGAIGLSGQAAARVKGSDASVSTLLKNGKTYFVVVKYTGWNTTTNAYRNCKIWLNPATTDENSTDPAITATKLGTDGGSSSFQGLRVRSAYLTSEKYHLVDAIRIGTTWTDVMHAPSSDAFTVVSENANWIRLNHSLEIAAGGVFDFSDQGIVDAPAGKYGALRATADGHFEFENRPGVRAKFWGVNFAYDVNYLTKAQADQLAERLARSGYNTVRIHHFDEYLVNKAISQGGNSWELDPTRLDQLEYLFAALKQRGIYINIDLFSSRAFSSAEATAFGVASAGIAKNNFKGLVPISDAAFESWKKFATNLLSHRNPYTGLTWAEDPALIGICPINENPPHRDISETSINARYVAAFDASRTPPVGETSDQRKVAWNRFIFENGVTSNDKLAAHIRSLGAKALITTANNTMASALTYLRNRYDYVDNHLYWDHPSFPGTAWALPVNFTQTSATATSAYTPLRMGPSRIFKKPFTCTEFHFDRPNRYRSEGALLVPAYASLQDWDAMYNFHYATTTASAMIGTADNYFSMANDPIGLIGDRIGALLFRRGDIAPAQRAIAYAVREDEAYANDSNGNPGREFDDSFRRVGLVSRIGSAPGTPADILAANPQLTAAVVGSTPALSPLPAKTYTVTSAINTTLKTAGVLPADSISADGKRITSDTGELQIDTTAGTFRAVTERGEHFILTPAAQLAGTRVSVTNGDVFAAVSVVALKTTADTGTPTLANARRILVTHLTDALTTGMTFAAADRKQLTSWGTLPHLVLKGEATLDITLPAGEWSAWAVDITGARTRTHTLTRVGSTNTWRMIASTAGTAETGAQFAYELTHTEAPPAPVPTITNITPLAVHPGESVTITGSNFTGATVTIGGVAATITAGTATSLAATVPQSALGTDGAVVVTVGADSITATQTLTITAPPPPAPAITSISATTAHPGDTITITGTNLTGATVAIGGITATITASTATSLTITVPAGIAGGAINVTTAGGTITSAQQLTVTPNFGESGVLPSPSGIVIAAGSTPKIYVSDTTLHTIQVIATGTIRTLAGRANTSGALDGSGTAARFNKPRGLTINRAGALLVADSGNDRLRSINADGIVTTTGTIGPDITLAAPAGLAAFDAVSGETYIADTENHLIKKITAAGEVRIVAGSAISGTANGALLSARFNKPAGVAVDVSGSYLYIADTNNHTIRLINLSSGTVSTFAGKMSASGDTDGAALTIAQFNSPSDLLVDSDGDVYVADTGNSRIRLISSGGSRTVTTLAGSAAGFVDAAGTAARFSRPSALAMSEDGTLYIADTGNGVIRRIAPDAAATVSTIQLRSGPPIPSGTTPNTNPDPNPNPNPDDKGGGGGGGGAPSLWFLGIAAALFAIRLLTEGRRLAALRG